MKQFFFAVGRGKCQDVSYKVMLFTEFLLIFSMHWYSIMLWYPWIYRRRRNLLCI